MPAHSHPEKNLALNRPRQPSLQAMSPFSVFERSSPELLNWLKSTGVRRTITASTQLIREGEQPQRLLLLMEGSLRATITGPQQRQEQLATLPPGSLVGEMSWLEQRPAVACITAAVDSSVLEISVTELETLQTHDLHLASELHRLIAQKLAAQIQEQNAWIHRHPNDHDSIEPLRKVLVLFAHLQEQDVYQLARLGELQSIQPGTLLLQQGEPVQALYLILSGNADILFTLSEVTQVVGSTRRGELLGEMSLLLEEQDGASAGVHCPDGMALLTINRTRLLAELESDLSLSCRFYRGLACMLSQRSRDQLQRHRGGTNSQQSELIETIDLDQLTGISRAARHFDWLCNHFQTKEATEP